jgi:glycosyltransferase involved in cell wall biosynthesis
MSSNAGKTLLLLELPPPAHGVTYINSLLAEGLAGDGAVTVIRLNTAERISQIGTFSPKRAGETLRLAARCWVKTLSLRPDTVYFSLSMSRMGLLRDFFLLLAALCLNVKRIIHFHGSTVFKAYAGSLLYRAIFKILVSNSILIALGRTHEAKIRQKLFSGKKAELRVVPNALKSMPDAAPGAMARAPHAVPALLYIGNICGGKGVYRLIDSLADTGCTLRIAGTFYANEKDRFLARLAAAAGGSRIVYHGFADEAAKRELFSSSDIFVMPSLMEEGSPVSIIEAMAAGLPVIATDKGCIREMIEGCGVVLKPDFSPLEMAAAVRTCVERYGEFSRAAFTRCRANHEKSVFIGRMRALFTNNAGNSAGNAV